MDNDKQMFLSDDSRRVAALAGELGDLCRKNSWPLVVGVMLCETPGSAVVVGENCLLPEHQEILMLNPQVGAGVFHAIQMMTLGMEGQMPESLVAVIARGPQG